MLSFSKGGLQLKNNEKYNSNIYKNIFLKKLPVMARLDIVQSRQTNVHDVGLSMSDYAVRKYDGFIPAHKKMIIRNVLMEMLNE